MSRIYDYTSFSSKGKRGNPIGDYSFGFELKYIDIDIHNRPEEYSDIDDSKAFIEYSVNVDVNRMGIEGLDFSVSAVELEFRVDDYPNDYKEFDMDFIPGKTVSFDQIKLEKMDNIIPTYPSRLEIDMNKSTDIKKYVITVYFGND